MNPVASREYLKTGLKQLRKLTPQELDRYFEKEKNFRRGCMKNIGQATEKAKSRIKLETSRAKEILKEHENDPKPVLDTYRQTQTEVIKRYNAPIIEERNKRVKGFLKFVTLDGNKTFGEKTAVDKGKLLKPKAVEAPKVFESPTPEQLFGRFPLTNKSAAESGEAFSAMA